MEWFDFVTKLDKELPKITKEILAMCKLLEVEGFLGAKKIEDNAFSIL